MIVHMGLATFTKFEQFAIEKQEADSLASSVANVADTFGWQPDPRFASIAGLVTTAAMIYGPRLYLYREFLKEKRKENNAKSADVYYGGFGASGITQ